MPFDLAETDRLLTTTRSVRRRLDLDRPVPLDTVLECIDVALQAPSGGNLQSWRWVVVDDPVRKERLAELYRKAYGPYTENRRAQLEAAGRVDIDSNPLIRSADFLAEHLQDVPVLVIPCLLARIQQPSVLAEVAGFFGSIVPATWSFMLALRSRGLGAAYTTLHLEYHEEAADVLGIPDTVTQTALLPVAYTVGEAFKRAERRPAAQVTYVNEWRRRPGNGSNGSNDSNGH